MKRTWRYDKDGKAHEVTSAHVQELHYIQPDFNEHGGRAKFREYLKRTGSVELGHSDLRSQQEKFLNRREEMAREVKAAPKNVRDVEPPDDEIREYQRSRISAEVGNRLHGRPTPPMEMLVKIALEEARRHR